MAKKIRFPLKLAEDKEVRTLDELREHFDLEKILGYYTNGKLLTWLEDRYLEGEAEAVRALDEAGPDFQRRLCAVFQVEYTGSDADLEEIERRQERLKRLRTVTDEAEYIQNIDSVAFDQEELADLLDEKQKRIYLCGETFQIPVSQKGITYIGINEPVVHLTGNIPGDMQETGIVCKNFRPDNWPENIVKYPSLHNKMDKVYIIREGEPIPEGVKETGSVEAFLVRIYRELGLTPETKLKLILSPKIDGVSINGTIRGDGLFDPQTRGDDSASIRVRGLDGFKVGKEINDEGEFGVQYELFVTNEDRVIASNLLGLEREYVSNRHAAAGIVSRLASEENDELLSCISLFPIEAEGLHGTYWERLEYLFNYRIIPKDMVKIQEISGKLNGLLNGIKAYMKSLEEKRAELSYSIDGMVITVSNDKYQQTLGRNGRTNRYQIALKFNPDAVENSVTAGCTETTIGQMLKAASSVFK